MGNIHSITMPRDLKRVTTQFDKELYRVLEGRVGFLYEVSDCLLS